MNLKTTLVLVVLAVAGVVWVLVSPPLPSWTGIRSTSAETAPAATATVLEKELTRQAINRIEIRRGDRVVVLEKGAGGDWTIDGKWLTRPREVDELVDLLSNLRSRFTPIPVSEGTDFKAYGLDAAALTVVVGADNKKYRLTLGEDPVDSNRFTRATYLRLGEPAGGDFTDRAEILRLAPGLVAALDRPAEYYLKRQLFSSERVAKSADSQEKVDRLVAQEIAAKDAKNEFRLVQAGKDWELKEPVRDKLDPEKIQSILTAVPDIWAEHFVREPKKDLAEYGLDKPEQTLTIARPGGDRVTLLVGKKSPRKVERKTSRPAPPQFGQPPLPMMDKVVEEFHYAKLEGNDQIFEIKADKLKDVFVSVESLRDSKLARFKADDVQRLELTLKDSTIVLARKDGKWRLEKPINADADSSKVTELIDKLAQLDAKGADIVDKGEPKEYSLEPPAGELVLTVEEETKAAGEAKEKKTRKLQFHIGKHDADKKKLYVKVDDWPRINTVDDAVLKLVERPALAYRGRSVFDLAGKDLEQIDVQRGDEKYALKKADGRWRLSAPVDAEADGSKINNLAGDLSGLNVIEYVTEDAKPEDLDKLYGLAKPALTVTLKPSGADAKPLTLLVGKQRDSKQEYFAKVESSPQVFVVRKDIRDQLDQPSLALRPLTLWQVPAGDVASLRINKHEEPEYTLKRDGATWKIAGPFDATVGQELMQPLLGNLGTLKIDKYETHAAKELDKFGLDKPHLRVVVRESDKDKEAGKEHVLLIGKPTAENAKTRFAKLGDSEAIVVVGEPLVNAVDRGALDMLDRNVLKIVNETITQIKNTSGATTFTLEKKDDKWQADAPQAKFQADTRMVSGVLAAWFTLKAERFAAYGPKADPAKYGLDKPSQFITISIQPPAEDGKPAPKPVEHVLALGKTVEGSKDERYAQLDKGPAIFVLGASAVAEMTRPYLDFVDHTLLDLDNKPIATVLRKMGEHELELAKRDDGWQIVKPEAQKADAPSLDRLVAQLARLRAERIAAYPAKELKMYGLDDPAAVLTLKMADGDKTKDHVIKVGEVADKTGQTAGDRYVLVDGTDKVAVLPGALIRTLVAKPLTFRDRALAKFVDADKVMLERGPRKAVFARIDGNWKLTEPLEAEADQADLEDFINALAKLRADELVTDKPEDLKSYGLDRPEARWRLFSGDKEVLGLVVGGHEKKAGEPGRLYAKLESAPTVFLLDAKMAGRALAEYRSRKLWDSIDASQVVRLEYGGDGRKPFTLEMVDNAWHVTGKPDVKISTAAVNDTLAGLASLRAERYVVDKGADPKLYGLEPPQLTIEVRTRTGMKRLLHVGGKEGDSKRHYARLPEGARSDVFVISEADAAKIVRDLTAFTEKEEKPKKE